jgi:hypothetical protein
VHVADDQRARLDEGSRVNLWMLAPERSNHCVAIRMAER